jgi:hypothetical protein
MKFTGRPDIMHYIGLDCYTDREGQAEQRISDDAVMQLSGTEAVLAAPCKVGDTVLKVRGESIAGWSSKLRASASTGRNCQRIAFGPDKLPNFQTSPCIHQVKMGDGILEVELYEGMSIARDAGTPVRMHTTGGTYVYGHGNTIPAEWTEFKMDHKSQPLRAGTNSVRIVLLYCYSWSGDPIPRRPPADATKGCSLQLRGLRWEKLS